MISKTKEGLRLDHKVIGDMVKSASSVLDMGCGSGGLLEYLVENMDVKGTGVEINEDAIYSCVEKGLSVSHGDIDSGLSDYPDRLFDYVIFNQTMQQVHKPDEAIAEALRIGKKVIIGFPNFCHITARFQLFFRGQVPITSSLPDEWYNTPNLHFLSIKDFKGFCAARGIKIEKSVFLSENRIIKFMPNLFALDAIFQISK
ncbi:MAG: methionine biosynthesis protein MetW [Candidatus Omnitrophica bacterium]|nr:methionine biosynthesis protein MetW [Candidatus Omnitrophota bacterium]MBU1127736.1 methionine biosynthesis protein MetW [Candidatus Omnitrophota bacterium]MBU1656927.1 methionine biosynthesis protein MetW [Candidatus Omnitrophota bacterium]MBU1784397.1 methionine biosynthesis protein MetW [Candidatus Omnitrophota bacterium]MBU1851960.1 methionine biosynthesis protein MetW [Candidatus Omnitrophota bacterium]